MRWFLDLWATVYRNTRAMTAAVLIWAAVFIMWGIKCQQDGDPLTGVVEETGVVLEVLGKPPAEAESDLRLRPVVIMLADSTEIQLVVSTPLPEVGDRIPLRVECFQSGKKAYTFDAQKWRITGPR
jgi:hypothetical protein